MLPPQPARPRRRVLVVDDHPLYRDAIVEAIVRAQPEIDALGAGSVAEARALAEQGAPFAMVVADHRLPDGDGLELLQHWPAPQPARVLISGVGERQLGARARRLGLHAFLDKTMSPARMLDALRRVLAGGLSFETPDELEPVLTERQIEVLQRAARGQSNRDIGAALGVTERTVKDHMTLIFQRLDVASRAQAVARAGALGLIRLDAPAVRAEGFGA